MKTNRIAKQLLKEVQLTPTDLARLALETIESLGDMAQNLPRLELISILRRTLREGVAALKAATQTVPLQEAAWASVEARTRCVQGVYENIKAFLAGEPKNMVNP